ncbi:glycosyl hydrolase [Halopseudomonas laoshanensis]|uniref:Glycosyl hydrolase n=1 Tax=Halopseudomonas laoshanensis TaxID=2268758 RepID=A0A7V7GVH4_9GAMM|nr:glycosyl hydrolase [Halopseudomonas laoshanensis]
MKASHLFSCSGSKYSSTVLALLAGACCVGLALQVSPVLASAQAEQASSSFHDPLQQSALTQLGAASEPALAVTRAGESLVSVGLRGLIMISNDDGETWTQSPSPVAVDLVQVYFQNELNGWAVGHDSVLLSTTDGGLSWVVQLDGRSLVTLLKKHYANASDLDEFEAESMLREVDLATSTSSDPDIMATPFLDVFVDEQGEGYVLGAFGMLLRTTDNGASWEPWTEHTDNDRRMHLYSIDMQGDEVYLSGEQGLLMRLDREAQRFVQIETPYTGTFFGVRVSDGVLIAYGLRGNLYVSRDSGDNWQQVNTQQQATLVDAVSDGAGHILLVSERGELIRLNTETLETDLIAVPYSGQVYSSAKPEKPGALIVAQFSGPRKIDISQFQ